MLGYDMSWASFNVVEVMSNTRMHLKSIGYLGATQSFTQDTDVLMLITNLLKKVEQTHRRLRCKSDSCCRT
jgi:AP-3 complex subunit delta-1